MRDLNVLVSAQIRLITTYITSGPLAIVDITGNGNSKLVRIASNYSK
jgi:hypothetical protein